MKISDETAELLVGSWDERDVMEWLMANLDSPASVVGGPSHLSLGEVVVLALDLSAHPIPPNPKEQQE